MKCPSCKDVELVEVLTTKGVMVDVCPQCNGV
ncbi:MAG: zf-TFIIB domain-containing protein [Candidatus Omnitrophica bacterium]|nr:zf-TFIIB domain-containing protein [Candidatus Omnitrophota bacterium]